MKRFFKRQKFRKAVGFVLSFSVSVIMLAGLCFVLWKSGEVIKGDTKPGVDNKMLKSPQGNLILALKKDSYEDVFEAGAFLLIGFDKQNGYINVMVLPDDLLAPTAELTDVLAEQYAYGGVRYCRQAIEYAYDIKVHRFAEVTLSAIGEIADSFGGMTYDLPYDMAFEPDGGGISIEYKSGRQTVNGTILRKVLESVLEIEDRHEREKQLSDFFVQVINEFAPRCFTKDGSFKLLTNFINTDITYRDFETNKKRFAYLLSELGHGLARRVVLKGQRKDEGHFFEVASQGREQIERCFGR